MSELRNKYCVCNYHDALVLSYSTKHLTVKHLLVTINYNIYIGPNILVTRENVIKIADLGLARSYRTLDQK
jgi:serine/threonine protein kinase